jgi:hypothetical protein
MQSHATCSSANRHNIYFVGCAHYERDYVTHEADFVDSVPHFVECSPCVTVKNYVFVFLDLHHGYVPSTIRPIFGTLECILMLIAVQQTGMHIC